MDVCLVVELARVGSTTNRATGSSAILVHDTFIVTLINRMTIMMPTTMMITVMTKKTTSTTTTSTKTTKTTPKLFFFYN